VAPGREANEKETFNAARDRYVAVQRLQEPQLLHYQEQEDHDGPAGIQQVLPQVP
jgi:hypothetical protein